MRVAVVTGASSGIGAALCRRLKLDDWHVVGLSRSPAPDADEHEACDVSDQEAVTAVAGRVLERHPRLDLLANNAGLAGREGYLTAEPELVERLIRTNYLGSVWCLRALLPGLVTVAEDGPPERPDRADVHRVDSQLHHLHRARIGSADRAGDLRAEPGQRGRDRMSQFGIGASHRADRSVLQGQLDPGRTQVHPQVPVRIAAAGSDHDSGHSACLA